MNAPDPGVSSRQVPGTKIPRMITMATSGPETRLESEVKHEFVFDFLFYFNINVWETGDLYVTLFNGNDCISSPYIFILF